MSNRNTPPRGVKPNRQNPSYVKAESEALFEKLTKEHGPPAYPKDSGKGWSQINERFFAELIAYEREIVHEADEGSFYVYNDSNGLWEKISPHLLKVMLSDRIRLAETQWPKYAGIARLDIETKRHDIIALLRGLVEKREFFSNRPWVVHAQNTMLVRSNGVFTPVPFSPEFRSRNQLAVAYFSEADCERFHSELISPALIPDDRKLIQEFFGLLVLGRNVPQRIFVLTGPGNTGKTTLCLISEGLIGEHNCAELRTRQLDGRFELARLVGKTLIFGADVAADFLMTEGAYRLKSIVGGDPLVGERKNSNDDFRFKGNINALITSNTDLYVKLHGNFDVSAWRRRLTTIPFTREPLTKRVTDFDKVLLSEEGSGILNYALKGLSSYYADDAACGDIVMTSDQTARVDKLLLESDGLRVFVTQRFVERDYDSISSDEFTEAYAAFARSLGWRLMPRRTIESEGQNLIFSIWGVPQSHNLTRGKKSTVRGYRGVALRNPEDTDPIPPI
jgi:hypothetical protein